MTEVGRCGTLTPMILPAAPTGVCRLPHGHPGWHRSDDGTEWCAQELRAPVEVEVAALRRQVAELQGEVERCKRAGRSALDRLKTSRRALAAQAEVIARVRAVPQRILNTVDPLGSGADVRMACVGIIRAALDGPAPQPDADVWCACCRGRCSCGGKDLGHGTWLLPTTDAEGDG